MKYRFINFLLGKDKPIPLMTKEQQIGMFAQLYENDTFRTYLNAREDYLIKQGMEQFLAGKINDAKGLAGQLLEIRNLRMRTKVSWLAIKKLRANAGADKEVKK